MLKYKSVLGLVLLFYFSQTGFSQLISINNDFKHFKNSKLLFSKDGKDGKIVRKFSVVKVSDDCIILKLESSDGYCGDETQIQLERGLTLSNHSFRLWIKPKTDHVTEKQFIDPH